MLLWLLLHQDEGGPLSKPTCGTHLADTKEVHSTTGSPVAARRLMSSTLTSVDTSAFSFCKQVARGGLPQSMDTTKKVRCTLLLSPHATQSKNKCIVST